MNVHRAQKYCFRAIIQKCDKRGIWKGIFLQFMGVSSILYIIIGSLWEQKIQNVNGEKKYEIWLL